jgi:hypothetical protein
MRRRTLLSAAGIAIPVHLLTTLDDGRDLHPSQFPTPERRGRLHTDLARAWWLGQNPNKPPVPCWPHTTKRQAKCATGPPSAKSP